MERQGHPATRDASPWEHGSGKISSGDFIVVLEGSLVGKEGFVKTVLGDSNLEVVETSKEPAQLPVISEGQQTDQLADGDELVSFSFFLLHLYSYF